ncbi:MAG: UDP-glucose 4-epimerase GalE [Victivallales bacterium]|nr:UDP-glucose 4-epimerase GalE [Victivallales bacterium]
MHIFVAGGAGYIGSCTTEYLLNQGHEVTVFDALLNGHRSAVDKRAHFIQGNLEKLDVIEEAVKSAKPDGIIHFAAFIEVGESMKNPLKYFRNNVANAINLCQAAADNNVRKVVFSSTAAVYGIPEYFPISEHEPTKPINPYGDSKLMVEKILDWQCRQSNGRLKYTALRYFNAAGATAEHGEDHHPETHLIPLVLKAAAGEWPSITVFGRNYDTPDKTCIRDYVHVLDLAQAHLLALESDFCGSLNLGTGNGHSVQEVIDSVKRVTGRNFTVDEGERRAGDPDRLVADSSEARRILGWKPQFEDLDAIVESAWKWKLAHPNGYED